MRRTIGISVLTILLTCSVYAGEIQNGAPAPPPPAPQSVTTEQEPEGDEIECGQPEADTQILLTLLNSVLSLL